VVFQVSAGDIYMKVNLCSHRKWFLNAKGWGK